MATVVDFTKQGNQVQVTITVNAVAGAIQCYVGYPVRYSFDAAGTTLNVTFGTGQGTSYTTTLANLRVAGAGSAPVSVAAALTALSAVFGVFP